MTMNSIIFLNPEMLMGNAGIFPAMYLRFAYIDPAATSYIIQIVAAAIVSLGAAAGVFWSKIKRIFRNKKYEKKQPDEIKISSLHEANEADYISTADILTDLNEKDK